MNKEQEQFADSIKKVVKAGLGAVATGLEKAADAVDDLSEKGEPIYNQAKEKVSDLAGKAKETATDVMGQMADIFGDIFSNDSKKESDAVSLVIEKMQEMSKAELNQVRCALEAIYPTRPEE